MSTSSSHSGDNRIVDINGKTWISMECLENQVLPVGTGASSKTGPIKSNWSDAERRGAWHNIFEKLLSTGDMTDFTFIIGEEKEKIPVHRLVLQLRSNNFAIFFGKQPLHVKEYVLADFKPIPFRYLIHYIYTEELKEEITNQDLSDLLDLSIFCEVDGLKSQIVETLKNRMNSLNVITLYQKGTNMKIRDLADKAYDFILKNGEILQTSRNFLDLSQLSVRRILQSDELRCSEIEVFKAAKRWGVHNSKKKNPDPNELRQILNPVLKTIRFPLMSGQEISQIVEPTKILKDREIVAIYSYICAPENHKPEMTLFNIVPRFAPPIRGRSNSVSSNASISNASAASDDASSGIHFDTPQIVHCWSVNADNNVVGPSSRINSIGPSTSTQQSQSQIARKRPCYEPNEILESPTPKKVMFKSPLAAFTDQSASSQRQTLTELIGQSSKEYFEKDKTFTSWDSFRNQFSNERITESLEVIRLENVKLDKNYTQLITPHLKEIYIDININLEPKRIWRLFDPRRFLFFQKDLNKNWKLDELWDMKIPITIIINGMTMLKIDKEKKELTITFRHDADDIMSGLGKFDHLERLHLLTTDVPRFDGFPCRHLQEIVFYNVWATKESDLAEFTRKCVNLVKLSSWVINTFWEKEKGPSLKHNPIELDLTKDLTSGNKLTHLSLSRVLITFAPKTVKEGLTNLCLETCFWPESFEDNIHTLFPNLEVIAIRMRNNERVKQSYKSTVTIRMLFNIFFKIKTIKWVRIWGVDWDERYQPTSTTLKRLRSTVNPVTEFEIVMVTSLLFSCSLTHDATNFIMKRDLDTNLWKGQTLNDKEPKEDDYGFWDLMDQLDFKYYHLHNAFKDYKTFQNNFEISLDRP